MQAVAEENNSSKSSAYFCYTLLENKKRMLIPILSNKYHVDIKNNFAEIKSVQIYKNPFQKPLEIHYSIPTDPHFALTRLIAVYSTITIEGLVKQREEVKVEYKEAKQQGSTVMMATNSTKEKSILKVRLGNIQPLQEVRIEIDLIGKLKCQVTNKWTLRIPSHIAPRYQTQSNLIQQLFTDLILQDPSLSTSLIDLNTAWDFKINLFSSKKILSSGSSSHMLAQNKFTDNFYSYTLAEEKVPQKDLQFTFQQEKFNQPLCTIGNECLNVTFFPPKSSDSNYDLYKGQYIFLLDRSGSMQGEEIKKAKQSLILFLQSLPANSLFNIISFGSDFERMFKTSVPYNDDILEEIMQNISQLDANMGGTQILSPLEDIIENQKQMKDYKRHVILLTDGQVQDSESVIQTISSMKRKNICTTHTVGIGNGVSFDMIRRGAIEGGGEHMFVMNNKEMKKQIIYLLESITSYEINNFQITYDKTLFNSFYPLIPSNIKRGRENSFFLRLNNPIPMQVLTKQQIKMSYFDQQNLKNEEIILTLTADTLIPLLNKYSVKLQTDSLYEDETEQNRALIIKKSIEHQVLTELTGYICIIQENANANSNQAYLLEMKNALEGQSLLYSSFGPIYVKTLTGKTIQIDTKMDISVKDLKMSIYNREGIPPDQQRLLFGGKQMDDDKILEEYNIIPQSIINLVLRLRGGGWGIIIQMPNESTLQINGPPQDLLIGDINTRIIEKYPNIPVQAIFLINKFRILDPLKTIKDYGINPGNCKIQAIISDYLFGSNAIVKLMRTSGFWSLDMRMLTMLGLSKDYQECLKNSQGIANKAMTSLILGYLKKTYPQQQLELKFIYKKVEKYLKE